MKEYFHLNIEISLKLIDSGLAPNNAVKYFYSPPGVIHKKIFLRTGLIFSFLQNYRKITRNNIAETAFIGLIIVFIREL